MSLAAGAVSRARAFAGVARLPFLALPVTLIAAGAAAGAYDGVFSASRTLVALIGLLALHAAVNALNEWSDMRRGIDLATQRTPFSGGSGMLPSGAISLRATLCFALGSAGLGLVTGIWLLGEVGFVLLPLMVAGAVLVLSYTDVLARIGLGEIAAGLGLGVLPVLGAALVQNGSLAASAIATAIPAGLMTFNLLLLNEFPDTAADRAGGRRNLVLLFGRRRGAQIYVFAALSVPAAIVAAVLIQALPAVALAATLPTALLAPAFRWAFSEPGRPVPLSALGCNVAWNLATNTLLALTLAAA